MLQVLRLVSSQSDNASTPTDTDIKIYRSVLFCYLYVVPLSNKFTFHFSLIILMYLIILLSF